MVGRIELPFRTIRGLARQAEVRHSVLRAVLSKIESNYRLVRIPKATPGEYRSLSIPKPTLKQIQRTIYDSALKGIAISSSAHAYAPGRSIVSHARIHAGSTDFIQIDIKEFFPSVSPARVRVLFDELGFGSDVAQALTALCTFQGGLPQGAPTSPSISNAILKHLDEDLDAYAVSRSCRYSRYADDLVISGSSLDVADFEATIALVAKHGFRINDRKSRLMMNPSKVIITGISISSGVLKVPKSFKRQLRQMSHRLLVSPQLTISEDGHVDPFLFDRVIGRLTFWRMVEPEAVFPRRQIELLVSRYPSGVVSSRPERLPFV
ncbi:MAG: RNA-directed DNA polymerase [Proteobacteria bacterium]|nr:MAG: RNA-directed DNA polymerase [Pseudomonadota bacterium]